MNRRSVLAGLGTAVTAIAGCSESNAGQSEGTLTGSPTPEPSDTITSDGTEETAAPADSVVSPQGDETPLRLLSVDAPEQVEIGEPVGFEYTLENPTDESLTFEPSVSYLTESGDWSIHDQWETVRFGPGEIRRFSSTGFTSEYLSTQRLRVDGLAETFTIEFVKRQLPFRETHVDPLDREITVLSASIKDTFEYFEDGYRRLVEAGDGYQWVFLSVKVINREREAIQAPSPAGFTVRYENEEFQPIQTDHDDVYTPVRLPQDGVASGSIAYKVPDTVSTSRSLRAEWYERFQQGDVLVAWVQRN